MFVFLFLLYQEPKLIDRNPPPSSVGVEIPFLLKSIFLFFHLFPISYSSCYHNTQWLTRILYCLEEEDFSCKQGPWEKHFFCF